MTDKYSIRDLASEFDVTTRTIRFYEEKGLLAPQREGQQRRYSAADRTCLRLILRGRRLGFSLDESAEIIGMYGSPGNNRKQLEALRGKIAEKRHGLLQQQADSLGLPVRMIPIPHPCSNAQYAEIMGKFMKAMPIIVIASQRL